VGALMSALGHKQTCAVRGPMSAMGQKRTLTKTERPPRGGLSEKAFQTLLSRRTGALRQPRARTKGEARVDLRGVRSDLQRLIGNVENYFLLRFLCDVRHDIDFCSHPCR
jgi:hypothetical protein